MKLSARPHPPSPRPSSPVCGGSGRIYHWGRGRAVPTLRRASSTPSLHFFLLETHPSGAKLRLQKQRTARHQVGSRGVVPLAGGSTISIHTVIMDHKYLQFLQSKIRLKIQARGKGLGWYSTPLFYPSLLADFHQSHTGCPAPRGRGRPRQCSRASGPTPRGGVMSESINHFSYSSQQPQRTADTNLQTTNYQHLSWLIKLPISLHCCLIVWSTLCFAY